MCIISKLKLIYFPICFIKKIYLSSVPVHCCGYFVYFCFGICDCSRCRSWESLVLWYTCICFLHMTLKTSLYLKEKILKEYFPPTDLNNKSPYSLYIPVYFFLLACYLSFGIWTIVFFFSSPIFFLYLILSWSSNWTVTSVISMATDWRFKHRIMINSMQDWVKTR